MAAVSQPMIGLVLATVFSIGAEVRHDQMKLHFDNPSSWDTPFLVPHFFEQRYTANERMLVIRAQSPRWQFEAGATPVQSGRGSDFDTFFQPSGDVVVHGSATDVRLRAWRTAAYAHSGMWRIGVAYSHNQSKFPSSISTTTHTIPPSTVSSLSTTRESTAADVVELRGGIGGSRRVTPNFTVRGGIDFAPFTTARLTTHLPDKYPNQPIRFTASGLSGSANVAAERQFGHGVVTIGGEIGHSWSYRRSSSLTRQHAAGATEGISLPQCGRARHRRCGPCSFISRETHV